MARDGSSPFCRSINPYIARNWSLPGPGRLFFLHTISRACPERALFREPFFSLLTIYLAATGGVKERKDMNKEQPFSLKKPTRDRKCYQYKIPGMTCYRSTGKTTKRDAKEFVLELIEGKGPKTRETVTIASFSQSLFVPGQCEYLEDKDARGEPVSR